MTWFGALTSLTASNVRATIFCDGRPPVIAGNQFMCFMSTRMAGNGSIMMFMEQIITKLRVNGNIDSSVAKDESIWKLTETTFVFLEGFDNRRVDVGGILAYPVQPIGVCRLIRALLHGECSHFLCSGSWHIEVRKQVSLEHGDVLIVLLSHIMIRTSGERVGLGIELTRAMGQGEVVLGQFRIPSCLTTV